MHPILFSFFGITIHTYGLMLAIAFGTAIFLCVKFAKKENIKKDTIIDLSIFIIVGSIIGARILYVFVEWDEFKDNIIEILYIQNGGLVYYGGLIGASISTIIFCYKNKIKLWKIADIVAPCLAIGQTFGRIGCFFNGCCYGKPTTQWFGIIFPAVNDHIAYVPTQLMESIFCFVLFFILSYIHKNKKFNGQAFFSYIIFYSIFRFTIEFFRGDDRGGFFFSFFSISQLISIIGLIIGIFLYLYNWNSSLKNKL